MFNEEKSKRKSLEAKMTEMAGQIGTIEK